MAGSQYAIRRDPDNTAATVLLLLAAALAAVFLGGGAAPFAQAAPESAPGDRRHRMLAAAGIGAGALAIAGGAALLSVNWRGWLVPGWASLLVGVGMLSVGLRALDPPRRHTGGPRTQLWLEVAAVLAIVALGTFLRFHRYSEFPDPFTTHAIEEQQTGLAGYNILHDGARPWEFMVDEYVTALAIALSRAPTFLTIRIPFTIFSALTILPVYLLLRQLVARPAALAGTFLFAVSSWNIIYSRCAHNIFLTNCFVVTVLALLVHFGRNRRLAGLPWAALLSGYTLYTYAGYRGTSLFALVFLGGLLAGDGWRWVGGGNGSAPGGARRAVLRDLAAIGLLVAVVCAVAAPVYVQLRADRGQPDYYFEAANRSLANKSYYTSDPAAFVRQRLTRIREAARIFMHVGDASLTFNAPREPMLDPLTAVCFVGGLFLAAFFPRRRFNAFLLFMFLALMAGGTIFVQNLDVRRLQGITVFVAFFAALFIDRLWAFGGRLPATLRRRAAPLLLLAAGLFALRWNYDVYFHEMAGNRAVREALKNQYTTLIRYGRERPHGEILLISLLRHFFDRGYYYRSHYSWLIDPYMHGRDLGELGEVLPPQTLPCTAEPLSIVIQKPYESDAVARLLRQVYPGTRCADFLEPDNPYIALVACDLPDPPMAVPFSSTLVGRYWLGQEGAGAPFLVRAEPFIAYATLPARCYGGQGGPPCTAEWSGTLDVAEEGTYRFSTGVRGRSTLTVTIDDRLLSPAPLHLTAGTHQLRAHATMPRDEETGVQLSWVHDGQMEVVPFYAVGTPSEGPDHDRHGGQAAAGVPPRRAEPQAE